MKGATKAPWQGAAAILLGACLSLPAASQQPAHHEEVPPSPPRVTYQQGLLSIRAGNATLGQVLDEVARLTGAQVEMPAAARGERVAAQLGPAPPEDVLATLLTGSPFDYIIVGKSRPAAGVGRIILSKKTGPESPPLPSPPVAFRQPEPEEIPEPEPAAEEMTPQPGQPGAIVQPGQPMDGSRETFEEDPTGLQGQPQNPGGEPPRVKTPQELLQELQRLQQQQLEQQRKQQNEQ